jgi:hypothetical protein
MTDTIIKPDRTQIVLAIQKHNGNKQISLYSPEVNALVAEGFVRDFPDPFAVMDVEQMADWLDERLQRRWTITRSESGPSRWWVYDGVSVDFPHCESLEMTIREACRHVARRSEAMLSAAD